MEQLALGKKMVTVLNRYKYAIIVLLAGIALMLLPTDSANTDAPVPETVEEASLEEKLQKTLMCIEGAGQVQVLLTEAQGTQTIYQTDTDLDTDDTGTSSQVKTVIVTDAERSEQGLILRRDPPVYQGAVIVCQGADSAQVRLAIVEAVRCATGLSSHQISVVKMK